MMCSAAARKTRGDDVKIYGFDLREQGLRELARDRGGISNVRGVGSLAAFTCASPAARDHLLKLLVERKLMVLASGPQSIRFRMPLVVQEDEIKLALERIAAALPEVVGA